MRAYEFLHEIDYCSSMVDQVNFDIDKSVKVGNFEGHDVFVVEQQGLIFIYFNSNDEIAAYIVISADVSSNGRYQLHRLRNRGNIPGAVTMLIKYTVDHGRPLFIDKTEELSPDSMRWLDSLLKSGGRGLSVTTQDGNIPDIKMLDDEWNKARLTGEHGPTSIFIEGKGKKLKENKGLLMPLCQYLGDKELV